MQFIISGVIKKLASVVAIGVPNTPEKPSETSTVTSTPCAAGQKDKDTARENMYTLSDECVQSLVDIESNAGSDNSGMPILLKLLQCVKAIENKVDVLSREVASVKAVLSDKNLLSSIIHDAASTPKPRKLTPDESFTENLPTLSCSKKIPVSDECAESDTLQVQSFWTDPSQIMSPSTQVSSLHETASLITDTESVLHDVYVGEETTDNSEVPAPKSVVNVAQHSEHYADENASTGKFKDPRIWKLTLAQICEAKPWNNHSLLQVCDSPNPELDKVSLGETGQITSCVMSQCRETATDYLTKNKISASALGMINETCKQMLYRLFTLDEVYNHNINGTNEPSILWMQTAYVQYLLPTKTCCQVYPITFLEKVSKHT